MAFVQRLISTTFQLGQGTFNNGSSTVTVDGARTSAKITKAGSNAMTAHLRIYGMKLTTMNSLSTIGAKGQLLQRNMVTVSAGDDETGLAVVFVGTVMFAYIDFQGIPDVAFDVVAQTTGIESVMSAKPQSFTGSTDVAGIMQGLASQMNLTLENSGVTAKLPAPYLYGPPWVQAQQAAQAAGINVAIDNGKLAIWPKNAARDTPITTLSPETGLINYPTYTAFGLMVRSIFNKNLVFNGRVKIQSSLQPANDTWMIFELDHDIESLVHHGQWFSTMQVRKNDTSNPVLPPA